MFVFYFHIVYQIDINDCVGPMCDNNGTCTDGKMSFTCTCSYPYSGQHCQNERYTTLPPPSTVTPEAATGGSEYMSA